MNAEVAVSNEVICLLLSNSRHLKARRPKSTMLHVATDDGEQTLALEKALYAQWNNISLQQAEHVLPANIVSCSSSEDTLSEHEKTRDILATVKEKIAEVGYVMMPWDVKTQFPQVFEIALNTGKVLVMYGKNKADVQLDSNYLIARSVSVLMVMRKPILKSTSFDLADSRAKLAHTICASGVPIDWTLLYPSPIGDPVARKEWDADARSRERAAAALASEAVANEHARSARAIF